MRILIFLFLVSITSVLSGCVGLKTAATASNTKSAASSQVTKLPAPRLESSVSLEETLQNRRSVRDYSPDPLKIEEVSQLLWAAQGITSTSGFRTAPSAGALYPLKVYVLVGNVENLAEGTYEYNAREHELLLLKGSDAREMLARAALGQLPVKIGAIDVVISAIYGQTTQKYGDRGIRYAQIEVGHAAQNLCLEATALDLGSVTIGAFDDNEVKAVLGMSESESPLYIIPVGKKTG